MGPLFKATAQVSHAMEGHGAGEDHSKVIIILST